jgi:uncharacterized protein YegP (UPF0339 family)
MPARFEIFPDSAGRFRFRLIASNGEVVGPASESYRSARDARRGTRALRLAALTARTVEVGE